MSITTKLSLATFVAVCILPSAFAGGIYCQTCAENPLQSPKQCQLSNTEDFCAGIFQCFVLTAELMNGTVVGIRGCFHDGFGRACSNMSACNQRNESLPDGVYFKRCVDECCSPMAGCNKNLFPMLPGLPTQSSVPVMSNSSIAGPLSQASKTKAILYLPIFLLITTWIMI